MKNLSVLSSIKLLRLLLAREEKITWLKIVFFAFINSGLEVLTSATIMILAQVLNNPDVGFRYLNRLGILVTFSPSRLIFYTALGFGFTYIIKNIFASIEVFFQNFSIQRMHSAFRKKLLHQYTQTSYEFYTTQSSEEGRSLIAVDTNHIFSLGMVALASILSEGMVFIFLCAIVILMDPPLALFIFTLTPLIGFILVRWLFPLFYRWGQEIQTTTLQSDQYLTQLFQAFKEIILLEKQDVFIQFHEKYAEQKARASAIYTATLNMPRIMIEILFAGIFLVAIAYFCLEKETPGHMIGVLGGYLYVGFRLMPSINRMINQISIFKGIIPSIERIYQEYQFIETHKNALSIPTFQFKKSITVEAVSYQYPKTSKPALHDLSFEIKKGECIGIVGKTGSGKSTLMDLILGMLIPSQGVVLIDKTYPAHATEWRQKIGYVSQTPYLLNDTIAANIALGELSQEIDQKRLLNAIEEAQLQDLMHKLPDGVQTQVGERGIRLSGGERQRIAIARALYRNPDVLVFDEATSALDTETESRLMETIKKVKKGRTLLMIAHRLTTLKDCDRILVLEKGTLKKITTYESL